MAVVALKSASVTNSDATPRVANTDGEGALGRRVEAFAYIQPSASDSAGSTYQMIRVPTTIHVKQLILECAAAGGSAAIDIGVYTPTRREDTGRGTTLGAAVDADFFASAVVISSALGPTNVTNESTTYTLDKRNQPLWQAVGLSADPGGKFDIVITVTVALGATPGLVSLTIEGSQPV